MSFLQPFILFGLPLALLPILIHLLNRLRHRPQPWGAMQFLLAASRSSVNRARLRQFLILLFRVLAVLALVLFLARPLAGGWLGWAVSAAPDAILLLVDRSASMEHFSGAGALSRREKVLQLMAESAQKFEETSHLILVDSALRQPQALLKAESLLDHPLTIATDAAADIPAMLQSALSWLLENQAGNAEIWIGSDMQSSNWQAEDDRWPPLAGKLRDLPQTVKIRLLAANANSVQSDASISLREQTRQTREGSREAVFTLDITRSAESASPLSVEQNLDGISTELPFDAQSQKQRWRRRVNLPSQNASGWGFFSTPPDANNRNNAAYFVYGQTAKPEALVLSSDPIAGPVLQIAADNYQTDPPQFAALHSRWNTAPESRQETTLLIWQKQLPEEKEAKALETFAKQGGVVLFLPPTDLENARSPNPLAESDGNHFHGIRWESIETNPAFASTDSPESTANDPFKIGQWDQTSGPLADTEEGINLPLELLNIRQRRRLTGLHSSNNADKRTDASAFASFQDGNPLLVRTAVGQGAAWFLATLPRPDWSSLADGNVLIPLVQRLLQNSARRQEKTISAIAGETNQFLESTTWNPVVGQKNADFRWHAGIYQSETSAENFRSGEESPAWLAVNRSPLEDDSGRLALEEIRPLFGNLPLVVHQKANEQNAPLQSEAWRLFLLGMLVFLLGEGCLTLPSSKPKPVAIHRPQSPMQAEY